MAVHQLQFHSLFFLQLLSDEIKLIQRKHPFPIPFLSLPLSPSLSLSLSLCSPSSFSELLSIYSLYMCIIFHLSSTILIYEIIPLSLQLFRLFFFFQGFRSDTLPSHYVYEMSLLNYHISPTVDILVSSCVSSSNLPIRMNTVCSKHHSIFTISTVSKIINTTPRDHVTPL